MTSLSQNNYLMTIISNPINNDWNSLSIREVPTWLKNSFFFDNLMEGSGGNPDDEFGIGSQFIRQTSDIENVQDFVEVIRAMSYWQVHSIPTSVKIAVETNLISYEELLTVKESFPTIDKNDWDILDIFSRKFVDDIRDFENAVRAVSYWDLQDSIPTFILEFVFKRYYDEDELYNMSNKPMTNNNLERFWHKIHLLTLDVQPSVFNSIIAVCRYDYYDCLNFLCSIATEFDKRSSERASIESVSHGQLENLRILIDNQFPVIESFIFSIATRCGHLDILEYLHSFINPRDKMSLVRTACREGHLNCLVFFYSIGYRWGSEMCKIALQSGHMDCVEYSHSVDAPCGCLV